MRLYFDSAPAGTPLTQRTLRKLVALTKARSVSPRLRRRVLQLLQGARAVGPCYCRLIAPAHCAACKAWREQLQRIWSWVASQVRYQADPPGIEHITDPAVLDAQIDEGIAAEDCDSIALYAATLCAAAGIRCAFEIQAPRDPDDARHVAIVAFEPCGAEVPFDPVGQVARGDAFQLGDRLGGRRYLEHYDALSGDRMYQQRVFGGLLRDDGGLLGEDVDYERAALDTADAVAKGAATYGGPYGVLVGGLIKVGEGVYGAVKKATAGEEPPQSQQSPQKKTPQPRKKLPKLEDIVSAGLSRQLVQETRVPDRRDAGISSGAKAAIGAGVLLGAAKLLGVF